MRMLIRRAVAVMICAGSLMLGTESLTAAEDSTEPAMQEIRENAAAENTSAEGEMTADEMFTYTQDGIVTITGYLGNEETVQIPQTINGSEVRSIGSSAFSDNQSVRHVVCPEGLIFIGANSFSGSVIETIELPETVISIGDMAFSSCRNLKELRLPASIQQIGAYAFADAGLTYLVLPAAVDIDATALKNVPLEYVRVSDDATDEQIKALDDRIWFPWYAPLVRESEESSFAAMPDEATDASLFEMDEEGNIAAYLGEEKDVVIPGVIGETRVSGILPEVFAGSQIESVTIPETVHQVGNGAFRDCLQLKEVVCYGPLETTGRETFKGCAALNTVQFMNGVRKIDAWAFAETGTLWSVQFDDRLNEIGEYAFSGSAVRRIRANARRIGSHAFSECPDLMSVQIGSHVEEVLEGAFADCPKLNRIYLEMTDMKVFAGTGHFSGCAADAAVLFPMEITDEQLKTAAEALKEKNPGTFTQNNLFQRGSGTAQGD